MKPVYVLVEALDQFAHSVTIMNDRETSIKFSRLRALNRGYDMRSEELRNVQATPGHDALIYHAQREAERCEDYLSLFEVYPEP